MPQVEFHILNEAGDIARLRYACQLVDQAIAHSQRVYVYAANDEAAQRMDELLWTFRDQAFIPHELLRSDSPSHERVMTVIGTEVATLQGYQALLINIGDQLPTKTGEFERICEIVDADATHKQLARERYKQYRELGCQLQTINQ